MAGIHLLEKELESRHRRKARSRLLVTTTFQTTSASALSMAIDLGLEVSILNPGLGRTFHPKLYLGFSRADASAVIGSANLTGGPRHWRAHRQTSVSIMAYQPSVPGSPLKGPMTFEVSQPP